MSQSLCFVLMPFGQKTGPEGAVIDFDAIYREVIAPAVLAADLRPLRGDEEQVGGVIHKPMFERLIFCEFAVADLTTANANVFYELGIRHGFRPWSTVPLFAAKWRLPFDVMPIRAIPYDLTPKGRVADVDQTKQQLVARLKDVREQRDKTDSPVYQLVDGITRPEVDHTRTDFFRERVEYSKEMKTRLREARSAGIEALRALETEIDLERHEAGVLIDLFLSYRGEGAWAEMIDLAGRMPEPLGETVMVQEQLALALNRAGRDQEAEEVLRALIKRRGPSSETYGILGRVYKDRWEKARDAGDQLQAAGWLREAIDAYLKGFETDWRDAYPGVNAVTLMELVEPPDERRKELVPVVDYAVKRKIASGEPDYWDHATVLELAVLGSDRERAVESLTAALARVRETWEPKTTARNLRLIREARQRRGEPAEWIHSIEEALLKKVEEKP